MTSSRHLSAVALALVAASCQSPRPLVAPPAATSNLTVATVGLRRATIPLGNLTTRASLRAGASTVLLSMQPRSSNAGEAVLELDFGSDAAVTGLELDLARATATAGVGDAAIEIFVAGAEPVAMMRCRQRSLTVRTPGANPVDNAWVVVGADPASGFAVAVGSAERDGGIEVAAALAPGRDSQAQALARQRVNAALQEGFATVHLRHRAHWSRFWSQSRVLLPAPTLQARYDQAKYLFGTGSWDDGTAGTTNPVRDWTADLAIRVTGATVPTLAENSTTLLARARRTHARWLDWRYAPDDSERLARAAAAAADLHRTWNGGSGIRGAAAVWRWLLGVLRATAYARQDDAAVQHWHQALAQLPAVHTLDDPALLLAVHPLRIADLTDTTIRQRVDEALARTFAPGDESLDAVDRAWAACLFARTGNAERALQLLTAWAAPETRVSPPLGDALAVQAVHELLLTHDGFALAVFPATPPAWTDVVFENLRSPGGHWVTAQRHGGRTAHVTLYAGTGGGIRLRSPFPDGIVLWNADVARSGKFIEAVLEKNQKLSGSYLMPLEISLGFGDDERDPDG